MLPETWPDGLRWIREAYMQDWETLTANDRSGSGGRITRAEWGLTLSPRFFVASEGRLLTTTTTVHGWTNIVAPILDRLVGQ